MSIHDGHRDRMRRQLKTSGMDSLSDVQVLEVLLYYAAPRGDTNPTAHALLSRFGTLDSVFSAPESELKQPCFSKEGDLWHLGKHIVLCGDSTKAECYDTLMSKK